MVVILSLLFAILYLAPLVIVGSQVFWEKSETSRVLLLIQAFIPVFNWWTLWRLWRGTY